MPCQCRCQLMDYSGTCCPRTADGVYMPCCAKAKAHPECPSDQYQSPEDAICPARTGKYLAVSHKAAATAATFSMHEHGSPHIHGT
jgi:hypothetical protein